MVIREPILQEMRAEHVQLQRDALELVELVSGKSKRLPAADTDVTMDTIHRANVVAQTRIHYNEKQLLQLMHNHLVSKVGSGRVWLPTEWLLLSHILEF